MPSLWIWFAGYAIAISGREMAMASSSGNGSLLPSTIIGMMTAVKLPASIRIGFVLFVMRMTSSPLQASAARFRKAAYGRFVVLAV